MLNKPYKINTKKYFDNRGFFKEIFKSKNFKERFVFDCFSRSKKNVFRGLHIQLKKQQAKIITVTQGSIVDYAVDVRKKSKNFGKIYKFHINEKSNFSIYIPRGFAHGFLCLSNKCTLYYKNSNYRDKKSELSINPRLLKLKKKIILSKKDKNAPFFEELIKKF